MDRFLPPRSAFRVVATCGLLCVHLLATLGFPIPTPRAALKDDTRAYPCRDRPCGCLTYDQCWAGDCCCFTLKEKLVWADARGLVAPAHAVAKGRAAVHAVPKACCAQHEKGTCGQPAHDAPTAAVPASKWVTAAVVLGCKGVRSDGLPAAALLLPPAASATVGVPPLFVLEVAEVADRRGPTRSDSPPTPPPKRV